MVQSRKIVCKKLSTNFRECTEIVKFELPTLKNDQVLVQVKYVGINASDINYTNGAYLPGVQPPFDCGFEAGAFSCYLLPVCVSESQSDLVLNSAAVVYMCACHYQQSASSLRSAQA